MGGGGEVFKVYAEDDLMYYFESDGCACGVLKETEAELVEDNEK